MKLLVSLYDRATEAFAPVMTVHTRNEAIRSFRQAVNDPQTPIHGNPTDYELYLIGRFDDEKGTITPPQYGEKELLARAEDFKE